MKRLALVLILSGCAAAPEEGGHVSLDDIERMQLKAQIKEACIAQDKRSTKRATGSRLAREPVYINIGNRAYRCPRL